MRRVRVIAPELLREHQVHQTGVELVIPFAEAKHLETEGKVEIMHLTFEEKQPVEELLELAHRFGVEGVTTHTRKPDLVKALKAYQRRDARAEAKEAAEAGAGAVPSTLPPPGDEG